MSPIKKALAIGRFQKRCGQWSNPEDGNSFFCSRRVNHVGEHNKFPDPEDQGFKAAGTLKVVIQLVHELKEKLESKIRLRDKQMPQKMLVRCLGDTVGSNTGCEAWIPIGQIVYVQTHWYVTPHGCTGGDYWNAGEGVFICPKCGARNRLYERPRVEALKQYFKEVKETHDSH